MTKAGGLSVIGGLALLLAGLGGFAGGCSVDTGSSRGSGGVPGSGGSGQNGSGGATGSGGASSTGTGGANSGSGGSASGSGGVQGGTGGSSGACSASIVEVPGFPFDGIEGGPGAKARVKGVLSRSDAAANWSWTVTQIIPATPAAIATTVIAMDAASSTMEFPVTTPGTYHVVATISQNAGAALCNQPPAKDLTAKDPGPPGYTFRASSPGFPVQDTFVLLSAADGAVHPFPVAAGTPVSIAPQEQSQQNGVALAYVRITDAASGISLEGDTAHGALLATLLPNATYDVLVIPVDSLAPILVTGTTPPNPLLIDDGVPVTVSVSTSTGNPVAGARMVLNRGTLPSTIGVSDASGALSLLARPGTLSALIVPPLDSGLPSATVGADGDPGIVLPAGASSLSLTMQWAATAHGALMLNVLSQDGVTSVPGARVRLRSHAPVANAGTLTVAAATAGAPAAVLPATGSIDTEVLADASGGAAFASLPAGTYDVTAIPPSSASPTAAITTVTVALGAGGLSRGVTLVDKVRLTGTLLPLPGGAGAQVTASDYGPTTLGTVVSATTDDTGFYALPVDPERTYRVTVQPAANQPFGRSVLGTFPVGSGDTSAGTATLPSGRLFKGIVKDANQIVVPGTLVQVFCVSSSPTCIDSTFSVANAVSGGDGGFAFYLPDLPAAAPATP